MAFIFQFVNAVYYIDLRILKNPCIPGIKPTWSWCMIFLMCCWILIARILLRIFANNFTIFMEIQKGSNSQSNLKKEEWSWRNQSSWLQITLQSISHQDSMVLAEKQKYRPREQDRKPRNKPMHLWVPYFSQRRQKYTMGQRQPLQQMMLGKLDSYM